MNRLAVLLFSLAIMAGFGASIGQAQTPAPATTPSVVTNYNSFRVTLGLPTTSPYIAVPATGTPVCVAAMNLPFSNTYFTPQGSDDSYGWHPLTGIGNGSIITPGVYVGVNPYRFFRLYFTQSSSPGASGYIACGDNSTSLLAPMLNGIDGVLNTYQELIAIGHAGCATFDANGFLLPTGSACSGGGGSFVCDAPHSCVTFQTSPSPAPEATAAGGNSAAVAGILQGGSLYTHGGLIASANGTIQFCGEDPSGPCQSLGFSPFFLRDGPSFGMDVEQVGNDTTFAEYGASNFGTGGTFTASTNDGTITLITHNPGTAASDEFTMGPIAPGINGLTLFSTYVRMTAQLTSDAVSPDSIISIGDFDQTVSIGSIDDTKFSSPQLIQIGGDINYASPSPVIQFNGIMSQVGNGKNWGECTMSAGTTCTLTDGYFAQFSNPVCQVTVQSSTPIAGSCTVSGSTLTIYAATSNSSAWAYDIKDHP